MRITSIVVGSLWFVAAYFGLGIFVENTVGYYIIGVTACFGFLILEHRL